MHEPSQSIEADAASLSTRETEGAPVKAACAKSLEPPVLRIGRALAVVPSVAPSRKAWCKLGFVVTEPFVFMGCTAFDVALAGSAVRLLAAPRNAAASPIGAAIIERLEHGAGLIGWTWACQSVFRSRAAIETAQGVSFDTLPDGTKSVTVPRTLTPGATTLLEPLVHGYVPAHPNAVDRLTRILLSVGDCDAAAATYERTFGLRAARETQTGRRCALLEVGTVRASTLQLAAPTDPGVGASPAHAWGLVFHSERLDETMACFHNAGVAASAPVASNHSGRVVALPMQIGGISLAFAGD